MNRNTESLLQPYREEINRLKRENDHYKLLAIGLFKGITKAIDGGYGDHEWVRTNLKAIYTEYEEDIKTIREELKDGKA